MKIDAKNLNKSNTTIYFFLIIHLDQMEFIARMQVC